MIKRSHSSHFGRISGESKIAPFLLMLVFSKLLLICSTFISYDLLQSTQLLQVILEFRRFKLPILGGSNPIFTHFCPSPILISMYLGQKWGKWEKSIWKEREKLFVLTHCRHIIIIVFCILRLIFRVIFCMTRL